MGCARGPGAAAEPASLLGCARGPYVLAESGSTVAYARSLWEGAACIERTEVWGFVGGRDEAGRGVHVQAAPGSTTEAKTCWVGQGVRAARDGVPLAVTCGEAPSRAAVLNRAAEVPETRGPIVEIGITSNSDKESKSDEGGDET